MIIPALKTTGKVTVEVGKALPSIGLLGAMGNSLANGKGLMSGILHDPVSTSHFFPWLWQSFMGTKLALPTFSAALAKLPLIGGLFAATGPTAIIALPTLVGLSLGASITGGLVKTGYKFIVNKMAQRQAAKLAQKAALQAVPVAANHYVAPAVNFASNFFRSR